MANGVAPTDDDSSAERTMGELSIICSKIRLDCDMALCEMALGFDSISDGRSALAS